MTANETLDRAYVADRIRRADSISATADCARHLDVAQAALASAEAACAAVLRAARSDASKAEANFDRFPKAPLAGAAFAAFAASATRGEIRRDSIRDLQQSLFKIRHWAPGQA